MCSAGERGNGAATVDTHGGVSRSEAQNHPVIQGLQFWAGNQVSKRHVCVVLKQNSPPKAEAPQWPLTGGGSKCGLTTAAEEGTLTAPAPTSLEDATFRERPVTTRRMLDGPLRE